MSGDEVSSASVGIHELRSLAYDQHTRGNVLEAAKLFRRIELEARAARRACVKEELERQARRREMSRLEAAIARAFANAFVVHYTKR